MSTRGDLARLLGEAGAAALLADKPDLLHAAGTSGEALTFLGGEMVTRSGLLDETTTERAAALPLLCVLSGEGEAARLRADLRVGAERAVGALVLGDWPHGTTLAVDSAGIVVDATGRHAAGLVGVRAALLDDAADRITSLITPRATGQVVKAADVEGRDDERQAASEDESQREGEREGSGKAVMVRLFGECSIQCGGERSLVVSEFGDTEALLGLLAENRGIWLPLEGSETKIWPNGDQSAERGKTVKKDIRAKVKEALGKAYADPLECARGTGYRLNADLLTCDVWEFRDLLTAASTAASAEQRKLLARAVRLYEGPFLQGVNASRLWAADRARAYSRQAAEALTTLANLEDDPAEAVQLLEEAADIVPTSENVCKERMRRYAELGRPGAVESCYAQLVDALKAAGKRPNIHTTQTYQQLTTAV
ncbi:hypothetical protein GCM10010468_76150 [Actinocorallia longicatena]|uniref:Bacterial transcriptional activator domain-containing protein n=1 Tax=Actinocorallia longicatena TaxID=111803 RepID=A0ABP6QLA6_9ACTN